MEKMENICGKKVKVNPSYSICRYCTDTQMEYGECLSCKTECPYVEYGVVIGVTKKLFNTVLVIGKESGELITSPIDRVQILE